jgi:hypothetical protein
MDISPVCHDSQKYDHHMRTLYERIRTRKGSAKAIVATAREMLVIIWYMLTRHEVYRYKDNIRYERKLHNLRIIQESGE